jgi:hypothetical protein
MNPWRNESSSLIESDRVEGAAIYNEQGERFGKTLNFRSISQA